MKTYDYIISGGGLAGLSLAFHLTQSELRDKKILIVDREEKKANDRTWCFWETEPGPFEAVVCQSWHHLDFFSPTFSKLLDISPYVYKMIRGIDFYSYVEEKLATFPGVERVYGTIDELENTDTGVALRLSDGRSFAASLAFNSIFTQKIDKANCYYIDQHFKGWVIETESPVFDPARATLMDFRIEQAGEARFFYVLPVSATKALVEIAIFSNDILSSSAYDALIEDYIRTYVTTVPYQRIHEEIGVIPMTDYAFPAQDGNILHIGTAGGQTKASTGYTFWRLQNFLQAMVQNLEQGMPPRPVTKTLDRRFELFDSTLLHVLLNNKVPSEKLFAALFRNNSADLVLKFLNEETKGWEEFKVLNGVPFLPFVTSFFTALVQRSTR